MLSSGHNIIECIIVNNSGTSCLKIFERKSFVWKLNGSGIFSLRVLNEKQPFARTIKKKLECDLLL